MRGEQYLHPDLQTIALRFLAACQKEKLNVKITDTLRTQAEQDALYAQGRTVKGDIVTWVKYPNSGHNWGVAFDFCRNVKGSEYDDSDGFFSKVGAIGKSLGLAWGGNFSKPDKPHLEYAYYMPNNSTAALREAFGTPEKFIESWRKAEPEPVAPVPILDNTPASWAVDAVQRALEKGLIKGDDRGDLALHSPVTMERLLVVLDRAGMM